MRWWLGIVADVMIVVLFLRVCFEDLKDMVFRKIRKKIGLE